MTEIVLNVPVECQDGPCGQSVTLIVDPATLQVTHLVVEEGTKPHAQRLVAASRVIESTPTGIRLNCTTEEVGQMQQFLVTEYRQVEVPRYVGPDMGAPYYYPDIETLPFEREMVPFGQLAVHAGAPVQASDGQVGTLSELLTDPETGAISHLVLKEGHIWGDRKVVLPVSMVESATEGAVQLKAGKQAIASMLAIPAKQQYGIANIDLLAWTYEEVKAAERGLEALKHLAKQDPAAILASAILAKDAKGKTSLKELGDVDKKHGALLGAITGGLIGLTAGPVGLVVAIAAGAATGRAAAKRIDLGFPDEFLNQIEENVAPGSAVVLALADRSSADKASGAMATSGGTLHRVPVTDDMLARLAAGSPSEHA
jgi:uncharacterized membrane protein